MSKNKKDMEELRRKLLADVYAGSMSGMGAMILDESRIKNADDDELEEIAKEYGYQDESKKFSIFIISIRDVSILLLYMYLNSQIYEEISFPNLVKKVWNGK